MMMIPEQDMCHMRNCFVSIVCSMKIYATIGQKFSFSLSILSDIYEILCGISDEQLNVAYCAEQEMMAAGLSQHILHSARYYHQITLTYNVR